jgi:hypothetical protein
MNRKVIAIYICAIMLISTSILKDVSLSSILASAQESNLSPALDKCTPDIVTIPLINIDNSTEVDRMFKRINNTVPFQPIVATLIIQNISTPDSLILVGKASNVTIGNNSLAGIEKGVEINAKGENITADNIRTKTIEILSNLIRVNCEPGGLVILLPPVDEKVRAMYNEGNSYLTRFIYVEGNVLTKTAPTDCMHVGMDCNIKITDTIPTVRPFLLPALLAAAALGALANEYCHHHDCNPFD